MFSNLFSPIKNRSLNLFDNSNRVARIIYRYSAYKKVFIHALRNGVTAKELLISKFPTIFHDTEIPSVLSLEFTNYCNLKCPYCTSPLDLREKGFMTLEVLNKIVSELKNRKINRIQIVGNGESTLHPQFEYFIKQLTENSRYVSIVTNGQWNKDETAHILLKNNVNLIEFSIDAGGKEGYEASRINGSFKKLIDNLKKINSLKKEYSSKSIILIRVMFRPSQINNREAEINFWKQYADTVMPQYLNKINGTSYENDLFIPEKKSSESYPKCSLPFYHCEIKWNGNVLMCYYSAFQIGQPGLILGNIKDLSIFDLWNHAILKQYRKAHRTRNNGLMPICKGCPGT